MSDITIPVPSAATPHQRKALAKAQRRQEAHRKALEARLAREATEEARQEHIAPAVLRRPVVMASGELYRHPVLEPAGVGFIHSNPIRHLIACGGEKSVITVIHLAAAQNLLATWTIAGEGVTSGVSSYGDVRGGDGTATTAMVLRQAACHAEIDAVRVWLGGFWPVVCAVALNGICINPWAASVGMGRAAAMTYLKRALDRLVEFYAQRDNKPGRLRSAEFSSPGRS